MVLYSQHPDLKNELATKLKEQHLKLFETATFIATNNGQIVKSFSLENQDYVIKRYPETGLRARLRSLLGVSRSMNSFNKSAQLSSLNIQSPPHLFVARHFSLRQSFSYLIMKKSAGTSLHSMIFDEPIAPIPDPIIIEIATMTNLIHSAGLSHGDLHSGNIFVLKDGSIELIDLDNLRSTPRRQKRDRERLLHSFDSRPDLREKLALALNNLH